MIRQNKTSQPKIKSENKIGLKINRLTIINIVHEIRKPTMCVLSCECGSIIIRPYREFKRGKPKSCGCIKKELQKNAQEKRNIKEQIRRSKQFHLPRDLSGDKYGKLTVINWCGVNIDKKNHKHSLWYCRCDCGNYVIKKTSSFKIKNISCGCVYKENRVKRALNLVRKWENKRMKAISDREYINQSLSHKNRRSNKTVRMRSFLKYGDRCLICNKINIKQEPLCIHHLRPHWSHPALRYFAINNIPLCRECHDELHKVFGTFDISPIAQWNYVYKQRSIMGENVTS